jgi:hypothetical protein
MNYLFKTITCFHSFGHHQVVYVKQGHLIESLPPLNVDPCSVSWISRVLSAGI